MNSNTMKSRFIGLVVISATFFLLMAWRWGFTAQGFALGFSVGGAVFMAGVVLGPVLIVIERRLSRALSGFMAIFLFPSLTLFFFRLFSTWTAP